MVRRDSAVSIRAAAWLCRRAPLVAPRAVNWSCSLRRGFHAKGTPGIIVWRALKAILCAAAAPVRCRSALPVGPPRTAALHGRRVPTAGTATPLEPSSRRDDLPEAGECQVHDSTAIDLYGSFDR